MRLEKMRRQETRLEEVNYTLQIVDYRRDVDQTRLDQTRLDQIDRWMDRQLDRQPCHWVRRAVAKQLLERPKFHINPPKQEKMTWETAFGMTRIWSTPVYCHWGKILSQTHAWSLQVRFLGIAEDSFLIFSMGSPLLGESVGKIFYFLVGP